MREVITSVLLCVLIPVISSAQMLTGQMLTGTTAVNTEESETVTIKEPRKSYIKALRGIDSLPVKKVTLASMIVPGYSQAYNRQYWKIPVIYGVGAAMMYGGSHSKSLYKKTGEKRYNSQSKYFYAGAGLMYLGSLIDGIANYETHKKGIIPAKATLFATFVPGLGQAYNGDYWKMPLVYGGFAFMGYWLNLNSMQYTRYRNAYNTEVAYSKGEIDKPSEFNGRLSEQSLKNYRDRFRRDRDYAVMWIALWHALGIIDATVFAHLNDFDVSEDLAFKVVPAIIPQPAYAQGGMPAIGLNLRISF